MFIADVLPVNDLLRGAGFPGRSVEREAGSVPLFQRIAERAANYLAIPAEHIPEKELVMSAVIRTP